MAALTEQALVWGGGLLGYSLAKQLAGIGSDVLVLDIDPLVVARINDGKLPRPELAAVMALPDPAISGRIRAAHVGHAEDVPVPALQFVCVSTEANGSPRDRSLFDVVDRIASLQRVDRPIYIVIESTLALTWLRGIHDRFASRGMVHGVHYHLGASPRRDVFNDPGLSMPHVSKIAGGDSPEMESLLRSIYRPLSGEFHLAGNAAQAMMVKLVENQLRDDSLRLINRLAADFPDQDMVEALELVATKWNMALYHPSLGIGGYCIPLARHYLAQSRDNAGEDVSVRPSDELLSLLSESIKRCLPAGRAVLLGLSYAAGLKIHTLSPSLAFAQRLAAAGWQVAIHDPLYEPEEIVRLTGFAAATIDDEGSAPDLLAMMTPHRDYLVLVENALPAFVSGAGLVIDNLGAWRSIGPSCRAYWEVGTPLPAALR